MKKRLQGLITGVLIGTMLTSGIVFAKQTTETIQALYKDIKIYVDGVKIDPKDANGNKVEPFIYNGTTYLPVRAVGEAINKQVTWDGVTSSVYLGEKPGDIQYLMDVCPPYEKVHYCEEFTTTNGKSFLMGGKKFTNGVALHNDNWRSSAMSFNLDSKYKSITLYLGPVDDKHHFEETIVGFYVDNKLINDYTLKSGDLPKKITIPVNYGMKFKITHNCRDGSVGFGDIIAE